MFIIASRENLWSPTLDDSPGWLCAFWNWKEKDRTSQKKKHLAEYFFLTAIKVPLIAGQNYGISNFIEIFLHPNNLTVVNCTHQRLRNVVHISKGKYKVFDIKIIPDHIQLRKSFSQEGYSTWPHLESEGFGTWKWPVFGFSVIHCIGLVFTLVFDGAVQEKTTKKHACCSKPFTWYKTAMLESKSRTGTR